MTAHGALEAEFPPGAMVAYATDRYSPSERGLVVRANDSYVFVRFERGRPSKAVQPDFLTIVADPIPDPRIQMLDDLLAEYRREDAPDATVYSLLGAITDVLVGAVDQSTEPES